MCYGDEPDINDQRLAELGAEQYQDELAALRRFRSAMQTDSDFALIARALGYTPEQFSQEQRHDR